MLNQNVLSNSYVIDGMNRNLYPDWVKFIYEREPKFFITFTIKELKHRENKKYRYMKKLNKYSSNNCKINTSDGEALKLYNKLLHFVNYDLYGRKYKQNNTFLSGFGCLEHQKNGQPHFHTVIENDIDKDELRWKFSNKVAKLYQTDVQGFDFQVIGDNKEGQLQASEYITKMLKVEKINIGLLGKDGLMM